jgi:phage replication-related protein YjqB (UPF0714/DUF867 family)
MSGDQPFADLLAQPGVVEVAELRSRFGFMAFHGGSLEAATDVIATAAAEASDASLYTVIQPDGMQHHLPSIQVSPAESPTLARFLEHVDMVVTVHGYGRAGFWHKLLLGGGNRPLAEHVGDCLRPALPAYDIVTDLDEIPVPLRGLNPANPVNRPRNGGVQIELPPRVRGATPLWADWEGEGLNPHTQALVDGLAAAALTTL